MKVIAHRGCNKEELENSFAAFDKAVACGADRIELDIQMTQDGFAVINHDDYLFHTTGVHAKCSELSREDFKKIKLKNGENIPFLDEVIERYLSRIELNLEIKGNRTDSAKAVVKLVKHQLHRDKVIVSSFCPEPLMVCRSELPHVARACLVGDDELPWPFFSHLAPLNFMQLVDANILHPRFTQVSESMMDQARNRGWKVFTWATMVGEDVDREGHWTYLMSLGVDGHCTNYPREMLSWIKESENDNQRIERIYQITCDSVHT